MARAKSASICSQVSPAPGLMAAPFETLLQLAAASPPDDVAVLILTESVSSRSRAQLSVFHQLMSAGLSAYDT